ncbi:retrotransposon protein, putative, ty1-copia subclass [Tanacetum coccineum]
MCRSRTEVSLSSPPVQQLSDLVPWETDGESVLKGNLVKHEPRSLLAYYLFIDPFCINCVLTRRTTAQRIMESLERKYKTEDAGTKKFVVARFLDYKMVDSKSVVVRSDRGGEYVSPFAELCAKHGIRHEFTAPKFTSAKRYCQKGKNRTLKEMVNAMIDPVLQESQDKGGEAILNGYLSFNKNTSKETEETPMNNGWERKPLSILTSGTGSSSRFRMTKLSTKIRGNIRNDNVSSKMRDKIKPMKKEVEPRRKQKARNDKSFGRFLFSFMLENEPTSYQKRINLSGCKPLGYKWIFKKKMKADRNLEIHQMDVKTAFLNGDLEEEIYMNQPEGFIAPGQEGKAKVVVIMDCIIQEDITAVNRGIQDANWILT